MAGESSLPRAERPNRLRTEIEAKVLIEDLLRWLDGRMPSKALRDDFERELICRDRQG